MYLGVGGSGRVQVVVTVFNPWQMKIRYLGEEICRETKPRGHREMSKTWFISKRTLL